MVAVADMKSLGLLMLFERAPPAVPTVPVVMFDLAELSEPAIIAAR